jgi:hypothetical protein
MRNRRGGFVEFIDESAKVVVGFQASLEDGGLRTFEETENVQ